MQSISQEHAEQLRKEFSYNLQTGQIKRSSGRFWHLDTVQYLHKRISTKNLCWFLATGEFPDKDHAIIHRDLDTENYKFSNLKKVTKEEHKRINRLVKNARKHIRLREKPNDAYDVVIEWIDFDDGRRVKQTFEDHTVAKKFMRSLLRELIRELEVLGVDIAEAELFVNKPRL
jgi:HNH endonuclease